MSRGLDHAVHAVRDLDAAASLYERLGFRVGARNQHPWGTHNRVVQLPGFFVELLTMAEPEKLGHNGLSDLFGRFNQSFLSRREGLSLLILESSDATRDAQEFTRARIAASDALRFEREAKRPDGSTVKVAFSLAFARDDRAPGQGFAVCQQHYPENFWNSDFQHHPNGVTGIGGALFVADNPSDHHIFASVFAGVRDLISTSSGITVRTPRGEIQIFDPAAFRNHFGLTPLPNGSSLYFAALRFVARDIEQTAAYLRASGVSFFEHMGRLVVAPDVAMGAAIIFEEETV